MKKIILFTFLIVSVGVFGYLIYDYDNLKVEEEKIKLDNYFVYGNHFNLKSNFNFDDNTKYFISLYNRKKEIEYDIFINNNAFYLSDKLNSGIYLDNIKKGKYYLFLKSIKKNNDEDIIKYYSLSNNTKYDNINYYTLSKYNNVIDINFDNKYDTLSFNVKENSDNNVYDVTIDPGHGGMDSGAIAGKYVESYYTMLTSNKIKDNLEKVGIKVKLTHVDGELDKNELLDEYNAHGRAVIPNEVKSKYTLSIHYNKHGSKSINGFEIYTPVNIDYSFAEDMVNSLKKNTSLKGSNNRQYRVSEGIYSRNFSENDINSSMESYKKKEYVPYNVTTNSNYFYMIRETGGYMTGAYIDKKNPNKVGYNPFYDSNIGNESYLLELGYLSNKNDMNVINNNIDLVAKSISDAIIKEINLDN